MLFCQWLVCLANHVLRWRAVCCNATFWFENNQFDIHLGYDMNKDAVLKRSGETLLRKRNGWLQEDRYIFFSVENLAKMTTKTSRYRCFIHRRSQEGQRGHGPPQIFRKYSHFVLWEAFFQTKCCYSPKIKRFGPPNFWAGYATGFITQLGIAFPPQTWSN